MEEHVCLVCLKTFQSFSNGSIQEKCGASLFTKFLKFTKNYLQISSPPGTSMTDSSLGGASESDPDVFCEKCELAVITPICQVYLEFLSAQMRLSWELEQLGKLLENSKLSETEYKLRGTNMKILTDELGVASVPQLEGFRSLLFQKCRLKRKRTLPVVLVGPRSGNNKTESLCDPPEDEDDHESVCVFDSLCLDARDSADPLDFQFDGNAIEFGETGGGNMMVKVEVEPALVPGVEAVEHVDKDHNRDHNKNVACPYCESIFTTTTQLHEHIAETHLDSCVLHVDDNLHKCSRCGSSFKSQLGLIRHEAACVHVNQNVTVEKVLMPSSISLEQFEDESGFELEYNDNESSLDLDASHFESNPAAAEANPDEIKFPCLICGKVCPTRRSLANHKYSAHNQRRYKCPLCPVSFKTRSTVRRHITAVHKPQTHVCAHCQRIFATAAYLKRHIRRVHASPSQQQQNWHKCRKCSKPFFTKFCLNRHEVGCLKNEKQTSIKTEVATVSVQQQQFHDEEETPPQHHDHRYIKSAAERTFPCTICGKVLPTMNSLRSHRRTHNKKLFRCAECDVVFKWKHNLTQHMTAVHNPQSHACSQCKKVFSTDKYLKEHVVRFHEQKKRHRHRCPKCGKRFYRKCHMQYHVVLCSSLKTHNK